MDKENILEKLKNVFSGKVNLNILENQVDVKTQMEYFELAVQLRRNLNISEILENKDNLFDENFSLEEKKKLLINLSSIDKVEAYRIIEKYSKIPNNELRDWSLLALQESKMLLESSLLGEHQVFISTGLGGKENKFRYFSSFFSNSEKFTSQQRKIIKKEIYFFIRQFGGEIEELKFRNNITILLFCLPFSSKPGDFLIKVIDECNVLGDFISKRFIITNVKKFSFKEVSELKKNKIDNV